MNILLANRALRKIAGSETWTITMYRELIKKHNVDIFTFGKNKLIYKTRFRKANFFNQNISYDLAIINHKKCLAELNKYSNIKKKIFTSHGIIPEEEQPINGADTYVAISEEVKETIENKGFKCSKILRNPIDINIFKEIKPINKKLKNILYISGYGKRPINLIKNAFKNYNLKIIGQAYNKSVKNVHKYINEADLVISLGRGVYEALSCNRNVIIFDSVNNNNNYGDGYVNEKSILAFRKNNCSGRSKKISFNELLLKKELLNYDCNLKMRNYIIKNNNIETIAKKYLAL